LSGGTNRFVSGDAPSKYLERLKKRANVPDDDFHDIIKSHVVNPEFMYQDDFYGFFNDRKEQILQRIERAMEKTISREQTLEEESFVEDSDEDNDI